LNFHFLNTLDADVGKLVKKRQLAGSGDLAFTAAGVIAEPINLVH